MREEKYTHPRSKSAAPLFWWENQHINTYFLIQRAKHIDSNTIDTIYKALLYKPISALFLLLLIVL